MLYQKRIYNSHENVPKTASETEFEVLFLKGSSRLYSLCGFDILSQIPAGLNEDPN